MSDISDFPFDEIRDQFNAIIDTAQALESCIWAAPRHEREALAAAVASLPEDMEHQEGLLLTMLRTAVKRGVFVDTAERVKEEDGEKENVITFPGIGR